MWIKKGLIYTPQNNWGWDYSHATIPVVDKKLDKWRIYYSSRNKNNISNVSFIDVDCNNPEKILYVHPKPILELGKLGEFDELGIMPTSIISIDNYKLLYYIGWSVKKTVPFDNGTGVAVSYDDGFTFKKLPSPILGKDKIDPYFTGTFFVLKDRDIFRGYYMSGVEWVKYNNRSEPKYILKYADSINGIDWNKRGNCIELIDDEAGICQAFVIKENKKYKMWFSHRKMRNYRFDAVDAYKIGYAESINGINWNRSLKYSLNNSNSGWDSEMVCCPCIVKQNNVKYMIYNGNSFGKKGFGYAIWKK